MGVVIVTGLSAFAFVVTRRTQDRHQKVGGKAKKCCIVNGGLQLPAKYSGNLTVPSPTFTFPVPAPLYPALLALKIGLSRGR